MLTLDSVCKQHPDVVFQFTDNEVVLVLPRAGQIKVLNEVGTFIWSLTDGIHSIAEVVSEITKEYQVDREQAQKDAIEFLSDLQSKGIIQVISH